MTAIGKSHGIPSASLFLRGGADGALSCGQRQRWAWRSCGWSTRREASRRISWPRGEVRQPNLILSRQPVAVPTTRIVSRNNSERSISPACFPVRATPIVSCCLLHQPLCRLLGRSLGTTDREADVLGLPRASFYRQQRPIFGPSMKAVSARALSLTERDAVLACLHEERFQDRSPAAVFATLLTGVYFIGVRSARCTKKRVRFENVGINSSIRRIGSRSFWLLRPTSSGAGTLKGPPKWTDLYLYVILDVFSRCVGGWMVAPREPRTRQAADCRYLRQAEHSAEPVDHPSRSGIFDDVQASGVPLRGAATPASSCSPHPWFPTARRGPSSSHGKSCSMPPIRLTRNASCGRRVNPLVTRTPKDPLEQYINSVPESVSVSLSNRSIIC
jgi:hypothetical protein